MWSNHYLWLRHRSLPLPTNQSKKSCAYAATCARPYYVTKRRSLLYKDLKNNHGDLQVPQSRDLHSCCMPSYLHQLQQQENDVWRHWKEGPRIRRSTQSCTGKSSIRTPNRRDLTVRAVDTPVVRLAESIESGHSDLTATLQ